MLLQLPEFCINPLPTMDTVIIHFNGLGWEKWPQHSHSVALTFVLMFYIQFLYDEIESTVFSLNLRTLETLHAPVTRLAHYILFCQSCHSQQPYMPHPLSPYNACLCLLYNYFCLMTTNLMLTFSACSNSLEELGLCVSVQFVTARIYLLGYNRVTNNFKNYN